MSIVEAISVEYIDHMGNDIRVANVARTSFNKWNNEDEPISDRDNNLLDYLATGLPASERYDWVARSNASKHWSPFAHCFLSVRCAAPIFLARQLVKHQVGLSWNEESRRYITEEVKLWLPCSVSEKPTNAKQGAGQVHTSSEEIRQMMYSMTDQAVHNYNLLLDMGVAPEEARAVLPLNAVTHWVWSGSLMAFARVVHQRKDGHAQTAAREFAACLEDILREHFPQSTAALLDR